MQFPLVPNPLILKEDRLGRFKVASHHIDYEVGIKLMEHRYNFGRINEIMRAFVDAARDLGDVNVTALDKVIYNFDKLPYISQIRRETIGINPTTKEKIVETTIHLSNDGFLYTPKEKLKHIPVGLHHDSYDFSVLEMDELEKFPIIFQFARDFLAHPQIKPKYERRVFYSYVDDRIDFEFKNLPANRTLRINFEPGHPYGGKDFDDYWDEF